MPALLLRVQCFPTYRVPACAFLVYAELCDPAHISFAGAAVGFWVALCVGAASASVIRDCALVSECELLLLWLLQRHHCPQITGPGDSVVKGCFGKPERDLIGYSGGDFVRKLGFDSTSGRCCILASSRLPLAGSHSGAPVGWFILTVGWIVLRSTEEISQGVKGFSERIGQG